jgi:hypothetical protein
MARERKGAIVGAVAMSTTVFFMVAIGLFYGVASLQSSHVPSAFWAAFQRLGLVEKYGFFWGLMWRDDTVFQSEIMMTLGFYGAIFLAVLAAGATLYYGLKTKQFASGSGLKQVDGLVRVEGLGALKKILAGSAKKQADMGVEVTQGVRVPAASEVKHFAFVGGSGSGKTNAMLPLLHNAIAAGGTAIVHDPKTDFTANLLKYKPIVIAPWLRDANAWHVSKDVVTEPLASQFAANMIPVPEGGNQVFALAAKSVLTGVVVYLQETMPRKWSLMDVKRIFEGDPTGDNLAKVLEEYYPQALKSLSIDKTRASVLMNLAASMQHVYTLAEAWKDVKPSRFVSLRGYLDGAEKKAQRPLILQNNQAYKDLAGALFKAMLDVLSGKVLGEMPDVSPNARRKLWFFLDETKALPPLDCVEALLNQGRSKGARVVLGCQNPFQISHWSDSADSDVWGNIATIFVGNLGEPKSEKWACELFGKGHFERWERSYSGGQRSGKGHSLQKYIDELDIVPRDELAELQVGEFFCRSKGSRYVPSFRFPLCEKADAKNFAPNPYFVPKTKEQIRQEAEQRLISAEAAKHQATTEEQEHEQAAQAPEEPAPQGGGLAAAIASAYQRADADEVTNA